MFDDTAFVGDHFAAHHSYAREVLVENHFDRLGELPEVKGEAVVRQVPARDIPGALASDHALPAMFSHVYA